ncbi:MaoC/PaaZ C-terminal domain-containing protein [Ketobacter sp.]|uniref:MaoC/PaaZ C-terminal domain-containing protein n=1 Tax=Ketobacter sp. TaxID=2083498 RepID=UPI000F2D4901|nr:MaoC/PaaZ C-terminal domain-containing protein [Ketobacter sp.]RLT98117.1 MAG: 3-alpha,7-alpha,12-alpha-trihydroxy-5-beta-cholest-24-enoyl-CoA hydratase [Ketobacter sp.]
MSKPIAADLVGLTTEPVTVRWSEKDVLLYALAVGCKPEQELDFVYEARGPKVLPTFSVIPGLNIMGSVMSQVQFNLAMLLHGEQKITLHRAIPAAGIGTGVGRIVEVWDKGKAAVMGVECEVSDDDGLLFTTQATLFIRGAGGFGGERGPSRVNFVLPEREPDWVVEDITREEQAALYRLTGDRNPIHIDPNFAKFGGFDRPFLHGLCTFGFAGRAALSALCGGDPARFHSMSARFSDQVYMGDRILSKIWQTGAGTALMQVETQRGNVVLNQCEVTYQPQ